MTEKEFTGPKDKVEVTVTYPDGSTDTAASSLTRAGRKAGMTKMATKLAQDAIDRGVSTADGLAAKMKITINGIDSAEME